MQLGFVAGTLTSAIFNLADVIASRHVLAISAGAGALANAAFALFARSPAAGLPLRFATGFFLAGVYPPGMKILATCFDRGRGTALGTLIGALTLGKASPYLVGAVGSSSWRANVLFVSFLAAAGALIVLFFVSDAPGARQGAVRPPPDRGRVPHPGGASRKLRLLRRPCGSSMRCEPSCRR